MGSWKGLPKCLKGRMQAETLMEYLHVYIYTYKHRKSWIRCPKVSRSACRQRLSWSISNKYPCLPMCQKQPRYVQNIYTCVCVCMHSHTWIAPIPWFENTPKVTMYMRKIHTYIYTHVHKCTHTHNGTKCFLRICQEVVKLCTRVHGPTCAVLSIHVTLWGRLPYNIYIHTYIQQHGCTHLQIEIFGDFETYCCSKEEWLIMHTYAYIYAHAQIEICDAFETYYCSKEEWLTTEDEEPDSLYIVRHGTCPCMCACMYMCIR